VDELTQLGANASVVACDVADRESLASVVRAVPADRPLIAVVHAAGVTQDGLLATLTNDQVTETLRPKVDGAWNLHLLTRDLALSSFIVFSSVAGLLGSSAQGNYVAANVFLDALVSLRRSRGLVATSLAWGAWAEDGMASRLSAADQGRFTRRGAVLFTSAQGLAWFDDALTRPEAYLVIAGFNFDAIAAYHQSVPLVLRSLVRTAQGRKSPTTPTPDSLPKASLWPQLSSLSPPERERFIIELVRKEIARVLQLSGPDDLDADQHLLQLGIDSLMGIDLLEQLNAVAGVSLASTVVFDYPTARGIATVLQRQIEEKHESPSTVSGNTMGSNVSSSVSQQERITVVKRWRSERPEASASVRLTRFSRKG
jgi:aryl carrier-like protein